MLCLRRDAHDGQNSDVRMNDLAFSLHCNLCSTIMLAQILMYTGDGQRITPVCWASTGGIFLSTEVGSKTPQCHLSGWRQSGFVKLLSQIEVLRACLCTFWLSPLMLPAAQKRQLMAPGDLCRILFTVRGLPAWGRAALAALHGPGILVPAELPQTHNVLHKVSSLLSQCKCLLR